MPDALPTTCLRCGSGLLTWRLTCNELPHVKCGDCTDEYAVAEDGDGWRMVNSRFQRMLDYDAFVRRMGARDARRAEHEADLIDPR